MDHRTISDLISRLKEKRGEVKWTGDGQFAGWQKRGA